MFGYRPMALLRRIRLQQVHEVLSNPGLRQQVGCHTVHQALSILALPVRITSLVNIAISLR